MGMSNGGANQKCFLYHPFDLFSVPGRLYCFLIPYKGFRQQFYGDFGLVGDGGKASSICEVPYMTDLYCSSMWVV